MSEKILFICGSLNQTTQLHQVARELPEYEKRFTPYYGDRVVDAMRRLGLIEQTIGGNKRRGWCLDYLRSHGLQVDLHGREGDYDLVVGCTDMVVPKNVRNKRLVMVQEGILDPEGLAFHVVTRLPFLPRWFAGTSTTGMSGQYDRYCVASEGYRQHFIKNGAHPDKVVATGIPNFDDCERYRRNTFPHRGYVLVCTSDTRETFKIDRRKAFIRRAVRIAAGRQLIFKLHPNENRARATREIESIAPSALVYQEGSAEEMIANCDVLLTQWSSTAFVGLALGKEVYSNFAAEELKRLAPIQNGGTSAKNIARVCREMLGVDEGPPKSEQNGPQHGEPQGRHLRLVVNE
jgi:hypothetical protein